MSAEERRLELERKKAKLAEMRNAKKRQEEQKRQQLLNPTGGANGTNIFLLIICLLFLKYTYSCQ